MFFWIWVTYSAVVLSVQKSAYSTAITSANRRRHESRREVFNVSSENNAEEFVEEIEKEESIEVFERTPVDINFGTEGVPTPTFLKLMYNKLMEHDELTYDRDGYVLRAIFPSKIAVGEFGSLVLNFEGVYRFQDFSTAHLILSQRQHSGVYTEQSQAQINIQYQNRENIISQQIFKSIHYYKFNITKEIQETLYETGRMNFDLKCDIFKNVRKKVWAERVFVTTNPTEEMPFVLLTYGSFDVRKLLSFDEIPILQLGRGRRALQTAKLNTIIDANLLASPDKSARLAYKHAESPLPSICRRYEWKPTPSEVRLDDVIFPTHLDLGYCSGKCPYPLLNGIYNYSTHSYLVDQHRLMRSINVPDKFPVSSCVPALYKPLMVLQRELSAILVRSYKEASVKSCGCR